LGAVVLERANLIKRVRELAITDSLTALPLRNYFIEKAKTELNRAREGGTSAGLAMFDIDDFKKINDTHGHMVGDLVLKKFAKILKGVTEDPRITVCRYGGEEFMVLLADTDKEESLKIAESIRKKALDSTVLYRRNKVKFTISGGLVIYPDGKKDFDKIFSVADKMMYQAKNKGKNRICSSL
ncbi:MAG: GGDEF domain-containing protein, partial [Candidatus Omnitrophica bacterium]|nr:GGDEF domain-containing protein [Candidatus Omnitrophota bacterium]